MPVFNHVTVNDSTETIADIMERAIGETEFQVLADIDAVNAGAPTPAVLLNGVRGGDAIPAVMLSLYAQSYALSRSVPVTTGRSLW